MIHKYATKTFLGSPDICDVIWGHMPKKFGNNCFCVLTY